MKEVDATKLIVGIGKNHLKVKNANKKGYDEAYEGDSVNISYQNSTTRRGRVGHQVAQTLQTSDCMGVVVNHKRGYDITVKAERENHGQVTGVQESNMRIRKLTPKECWRLMGFTDEEFEKAKAVNSDSQLYKQAGNSIVVDVLEAILRNLLTIDRNEKDTQTTMF